MVLKPEMALTAKLLAAWLITGAGICYGDTGRSDPFSGLAPLTDQELDVLRGGFITSQGVSIQIGYEQLANLDGVLRPTLSISPDDIAKLAAAGATELTRMLGSGTDGTVGSGGHIIPLDTINSYLTLLQNSSNNKTLGVINVFDVSIKNLSSIANQGVGKLFQYQLTQSLR